MIRTWINYKHPFGSSMILECDSRYTWVIEKKRCESTERIWDPAGIQILTTIVTRNLRQRSGRQARGIKRIPTDSHSLSWSQTKISTSYDTLGCPLCILSAFYAWFRLPSECEYPPQNNCLHCIWMFLWVCKGQSGSPAASKHHPLTDPQVLP